LNGFSNINVNKKNTMNLSENLSVDKELFSGVYKGKYNMNTFKKNITITVYKKKNNKSFSKETELFIENTHNIYDNIKIIDINYIYQYLLSIIFIYKYKIIFLIILYFILKKIIIYFLYKNDK